jgi:bacterioferritin
MNNGKQTALEPDTFTDAGTSNGWSALDHAATARMKARKADAISLLNDALAEEMERVLRHRRNRITACASRTGSNLRAFLVYCVEAQARAHGFADRIAARIVELGGELEFRAATLAALRACDAAEARSLRDLVREEDAARRATIERYHLFIRYLGDEDNTTRKMMEEIVATEEAHAQGSSNTFRVGGNSRGGQSAAPLLLVR